MSGSLNDVRSGFRILIRSPGPALLAVAILAIGIGLTTAMFSIVYGLVLRGLPIEGAEELVHVQASRVEQGVGSRPATLPQFLDWRAEQSSFRELHAFRGEAVTFSGDGLPERLAAARITPGTFAHLGIEPAHGRSFSVEDARSGAPPVALLGHDVWQRRFGGDRGILGRTVRIDGEPVTVVGVMPEGFQFPERQEVWFPLDLEPGVAPRGEAPADLHVFGRLRDGVGIDGARADLTAVSRQLAEQHPEAEAGLGISMQPYRDYFVDSEDVSLGWISLGAVGFVLLIACFNVANLLLARASRRARELAVRSVVGADRWRVARQVLGESLALALIASVVGVGLAMLLIERFNRAVAGRDWPFWFDVRLDTPAVLFVAGLTILVSLLAGSLPAWRSSRLSVGAVLKDEARGSRRGRVSTALVVAEVALSCTLLVAAGLMVRTLVNLSRLDFAFEVDRLFAGRITLIAEDDPESNLLGRTWEAIEGRVEALAEVEAAAIADSVPAAEWASMSRYAVDLQMPASEQDQRSARRVRVSPSFFATLDVEPLAGRALTARDRAGTAPVAVVNRSFADRHWPDGSAIGKTVRFGAADDEEPWRQIVGVVPDLNAGGPRDQGPAAVYLPLAQSMTRSGVLLARVRGDVEAAVPTIRRAVAAVDADLPIFFAGPLRHKIAQQLFFYRMVGTIFTIMAAVALLLAVSGLYGLLSFSVSERTSELGVRMALGATAREVLFLVVGSGLRKVLIGLAVGFVLAIGVTSLIESQLVGVEPYDVPTFLLVGLALLATGLLAALLPALRASRVVPMDALRLE
jgi:putative ABC transport system permease protein